MTHAEIAPEVLQVFFCVASTLLDFPFLHSDYLHCFSQAKYFIILKREFFACSSILYSARAIHISRTNGYSLSRVHMELCALPTVRSAPCGIGIDICNPRFSSRFTIVLILVISMQVCFLKTLRGLNELFLYCIRAKEDEQLPLQDPVIAEIARSHGRTPAQV